MTERDFNRSHNQVLRAEVDMLKTSFKEIRDSVKSIEACLTVLARIETRHEAILDSITRMSSRQDTQGDALDKIVPQIAVQAATLGRHEKILWLVSASTVTAIIGGIAALLLKG